MLFSLVNSPSLKLGAIVGAAALVMATASSAEAATIFDVTGSFRSVEFKSSSYGATTRASLSGTLTYDAGAVTAANIVLGGFAFPSIQPITFSSFSSPFNGNSFSLVNRTSPFGNLLLSFNSISPSFANGVLAQSDVQLSREDTSVYQGGYGRGNATFTPRDSVPTPAMLSGLVGLGITTWRKRRQRAKLMQS
jgi:hypothetical protein